MQKRTQLQAQLRDAAINFKLCGRSTILPVDFAPVMRQQHFASVLDERLLDPGVRERCDMIREARSVALDVMNGTALPKRDRPRSHKSIMERIVSRRTGDEPAAAAADTAAPGAGGAAAEDCEGTRSMWDDYLQRGGAVEARHAAVGRGASAGVGAAPAHAATEQQPAVRATGGGCTTQAGSVSVPARLAVEAGDGLGSGLHAYGAAGAPFLTQ